MDRSPTSRALIGYFSAAIAVLIFEQGSAGLLYKLVLRGLEISHPAYDMTPLPPFGTPAVVVRCLEEGLLGLVFGLVTPGLSRPLSLPGMLLGLIYGLVMVFVIPHLHMWGTDDMAAPIPRHWPALLVVETIWGFGVGVIYTLLAPPSPGHY